MPKSVSFDLFEDCERIANECRLLETHQKCRVFRLQYHFVPFQPGMQHKMALQQRCWCWKSIGNVIIAKLSEKNNEAIGKTKNLFSIKCWPNFFKVVLCVTSLKKKINSSKQIVWILLYVTPLYNLYRSLTLAMAWFSKVNLLLLMTFHGPVNSFPNLSTKLWHLDVDVNVQ